MTISLIDSASAMRRVVDAEPQHRADLVRQMWEPMAGMYHFIPGGVDMAETHGQNFGFPLSDDAEQVSEGLDKLIAADAWQRIEEALICGIEALEAADSGVKIPDLKVLIVLGDPGNAHFMNEAQGLSGFGGISGYIVLTIWPTPRVLDRLEAIAVHELHHNVRYSPDGIIWNPATVTVGEHVVAEGLADVFAVELYGEKGYTHFVSKEVYADDDVLAKVVTGLDVTGMQDFAAWVLGDVSARQFGGEPVGLPTGAGYAVGARIVSAYRDRAGVSAAQAVRKSATDIIDAALPHLGLKPLT
ncbi:DUF2268 domain-containing protein [Brevibacterium zhoupengii]|uniref:DUF2268 domain-containing protein n=1 Tax=Brevibacterium zhoupengii TaxID=2898795 RepID=UPI001E584907|nr:DUF2268 domain-containing putative Zn-dependent protease [Brevibacterium zhoupengii]